MNELIIERVLNTDNGIFNLLREGFPEVRWDLERLKTFLASSSNILLAARKEDKVCGLIRAHILPRYDVKNQEILLHEIDVSPAFQRQGIAAALIEKLKVIAKASGASEIWVVTNRSNTAAMSLYGKTKATAPRADDAVFIYEL